MVTGCMLWSSNDTAFENLRLKSPNSVVVCRAKQCAPSKISMSSEYIFNSLSHLMGNNNREKALICEANPASHNCTENFITLPVRVGITPAYMYIDSVKIIDVNAVKGSPMLNLVLNYNITYNGQSPECRAANSMMYVKNSDNIVLEDGGYDCKMTTIGTTSVKTLFLIDYIDLDYGYIGGFYSIGLNGPATGGGTGYMLFRLTKDAYPLSPYLETPKNPNSAKASHQSINTKSSKSVLDTNVDSTSSNVKIFPIKR